MKLLSPTTGPACIYCGCHDRNPCMTADGPCGWFCDEPAICDADPCVAKARADAMRLADDGDCVHQPLWTSATRCHCVRCGAELQEAA